MAAKKAKEEKNVIEDAVVETVTTQEIAEVAPKEEVLNENMPQTASMQLDKNTAAIVAADSWDEKLRIADSMIEGGLVPRAFANDPGAVISAVEMGLELGLGAWASLNNIVVIQGRATLSLNAMLSLARSKGVLIKVIKDYELVPIEIRTKEGIKKSSDRATTVVITRGEDIYSPSGKLLDSRISDYEYTKYWAEAKKADLIDKDNWKRMPRLMLRARAITEALRLYAADIMLGMYETTEIDENSQIVIDIKQ